MASKPKKAKTNGFLLFAQEFSVRFEILQIYFTNSLIYSEKINWQCHLRTSRILLAHIGIN